MLMYNNEQKNQINDILESLTDELDIPESKYNEAIKRYEAVGNWLLREDSVLKDYNPQIYPQGSFNLGTMIKPINNNDEYDIDLVCELNCDKLKFSQKELKDKVGYEILSYAISNNMLKRPEDNRRCWTLDYANEFHMDILPAIPDGNYFIRYLEAKQFSADYSDEAIAITDKTHKHYDIITYEWLCSNPRGFMKWFKKRMESMFYIRRSILAKALNENVDRIPEYKVKTPLQRAIQLLKRHRDIYFTDKKNKPISMIITTLAAKAYDNEDNLFDAIMNISANIENVNTYFINGKYQILNPVNPDENFADKWNENIELPRAFQRWINKVREEFIDLFGYKGIHNLSEKLYPVYGEDLMKAAMIRYGNRYLVNRKSGLLKMAGWTGTIGLSGSKTVKDHTFYGK